jgi:hypothetical protein
MYKKGAFVGVMNEQFKPKSQFPSEVIHLCLYQLSTKTRKQAKSQSTLLERKAHVKSTMKYTSLQTHTHICAQYSKP